jgi:hypothetical protein
MLTQDFADLIFCLDKHRANYILVGAFAMAYFGYRRATGDIDIFVEPSLENSPKVMAALREFGAPLSVHSVSDNYFSVEGHFYQIGVAPNRIDVITKISGMSYAEACSNAVVGNLLGRNIPILSLDFLIRNKKASGRPKDLVDVEELEKLKGVGAGHDT